MGQWILPLFLAGPILRNIGGYVSEENRWLALALIVVGAILIFLYSSDVSKAQEGHTHEGAVGKFYSTWMMPDNRRLSCCHERDCAPAQSQRGPNGWQARNSDAEEWLDVPEHKIETERDSPDGRSHLCKTRMPQGWNVLCFLPAGAS